MTELLQCGRRCGTQKDEFENVSWRELKMRLAIKHYPWKRGNEGTRNPERCVMTGAESGRLNLVGIFKVSSEAPGWSGIP